MRAGDALPCQLQRQPGVLGVVIGALFLVGGLALILWGAERFTDGAIRTATRFALSPFVVGAVVSGFEPENLITGAAAAAGGLPQIALGTVIGSAIFLLTGALGLALLLVPMAVRIPRAGPLAMLAILALFTGAVLTGGTVGRSEGGLLVAAAVGLMIWLYRLSPLVLRFHAPFLIALCGVYFAVNVACMWK